MSLKDLDMKYGIVPANHGFNFIYNGSDTKWSMTIGSMVPVDKRSKLEHYYIIIRNRKNVADRVFLNGNGAPEWVFEKKDIPKYVAEVAEYIMMSGDVNRFIIGDTVINNKFTRIGNG